MAIILNGTTGITSPGGDIAVSETFSGNVNFTGTGNRITGYFSNTTVANRVVFQSSTTNGNTGLVVIPNGTATSAAFEVNTDSSGGTNGSRLYLNCTSTASEIGAGIRGTGTYLPMTFYTGGSERVRIDTSGNVSQAGGSYFLGNGGGFGWGDLSTYIGGTSASDFINFNTNGSERMRIDSSGNVGINCTAYGGYKLQVRTGTNQNLGIGTSSGGDGLKFNTYNDAGSANVPLEMNGSFLAFRTGEVERMRIDSSGNLLVGLTTTLPNWLSSFYSNTAGAWPLSVRGNNRGMVFRVSASSGIAAYFETSDGSSVAGQITVSGTTTTYATSSDYRLKENIQPMQNALGVVAQLNPVTYTWKSTGEQSQGFIAHELQAVVPDCVTGEKDAVDAEGNPVYQGIDTSFLVATLTAAIQELEARVKQLEGK